MDIFNGENEITTQFSRHAGAFECAGAINTNLSWSRTEALRGGVVRGGGVVGSSGRGDTECTADILIVPMFGLSSPS